MLVSYPNFATSQGYPAYGGFPQRPWAPNMPYPAVQPSPLPGHGYLQGNPAAQHNGSYSGMPPVQPAPPAIPSVYEEQEDVDPDEDAMLYLPCIIRGKATEMLLDTGAQVSVITLPMVRHLGMEDEIDDSIFGVAAGVGKALILGDLRSVEVMLGQMQFKMNFKVLSLREPLLILGVDQLQRFKCIVDLESRVLRFGGARGKVAVPFIPPAQRQVVVAPSGGHVGCCCM
mmetsp:Transcript_58714/g.108303  ORF Transcript_58714/g.108303 Transcript_58714/m.108303 type:complete len:229 (-) Transcript_58714:114-800(-)